MKEVFISENFEQTKTIAGDFALSLKSGDIVLLDGDLGAGKTVFSKGVVERLSNGKITAVSPTFVIVNVYDSTPPIFHFDFYRISDESELAAIGAEEYLFSGNGISLIEWPSRANGYFKNDIIKIFIEKLSDNKRQITIER